MVKPSMVGRRVASPVSSNVLNSNRSSDSPARFLHSKAIQRSCSPPLTRTNYSTAPVSPTKSAGEDSNAYSTEGATRESLHMTTEECSEKFESLLLRGKDTPIEQFEEIFRSLARSRDFATSLSFLEKLRDLKDFKVNGEIYNHVLCSGMRGAHLNEIRELFGEFKERRVGLPEMEPSQLFPDMKLVLDWMREDGHEVSMAFYEELADWLSFINQGGCLINISLTLEHKGIQPSTKFYNKMLHCLPRSGFNDRADALFNRMLFNNFANQRTFSVRIGSLVSINRLSEAEQVFSQMKKLFGLDVAACNSMIQGYLRAKKANDAFKVLEEMKNGGQSAVPNSLTANTFVSYFYNSGDLMSAPKILEYFSSTVGYPQNCFDYGNLIKLYSRADPGKAVECFRECQKNVAKLDIDVYNCILCTLIDPKSPSFYKHEISNAILGNPLDRPLLAPSPDSICRHLSTCAPDFIHIVSLMEKEGLKLNNATFEVMMKAVRARGDDESAMKLYNVLAETHRSIFSSIRNMYLHSLLRTNKVDEAKDFAANMVHRRQRIFDFHLKKLQSLGFDKNVAQNQGFRNAKHSNDFASSTAAKDDVSVDVQSFAEASK